MHLLSAGVAVHKVADGLCSCDYDVVRSFGRQQEMIVLRKLIDKWRVIEKCIVCENGFLLTSFA